jgi:hypothetical protein
VGVSERRRRGESPGRDGQGGPTAGRIRKDLGEQGCGGGDQCEGDKDAGSQDKLAVSDIRLRAGVHVGKSYQPGGERQGGISANARNAYFAV